MKRFFTLVSILSVATMLWATPTKQELRIERDALKADMIAAGVYDQVVNSSHPLQETIPAELHTRLVQLWDNYQTWVVATFPPEIERVNTIKPEIEPNDTLADANVYGSAHAYRGDALAGDVDFFAYNCSGLPHDLVIFNHMAQTGATATDDSEMSVYQPDGSLLFTTTGGGAFGNAVAAFFAPTSGQYKFSLAMDSGSATATGVDPYNVYALEIPMAPSGNVLVNDGDFFTHTFDAEANDSVHIAAFVDADPALTSYDIDLELFDPAAVSMDTAMSTAVNFEFMPFEIMPVSGTYSVDVSQWSLAGTPQEYEFGVYVSILRVPTLSTWGIVFFTCLLAGSGLFMLRRRRNAQAA